MKSLKVTAKEFYAKQAYFIRRLINKKYKDIVITVQGIPMVKIVRYWEKGIDKEAQNERS